MASVMPMVASKLALKQLEDAVQEVDDLSQSFGAQVKAPSSRAVETSPPP